MTSIELIQILGAVALVITAVGSVIAAASSLRNGKIADAVKAKVEENTKATIETNEKMTRISMDVDGRFSATQAQLSRVVDHIIAINPGMITRAALAAEKLLDVAATARATLAHETEKPVDVNVVPGDDPLPVLVVDKR